VSKKTNKNNEKATKPQKNTQKQIQSNQHKIKKQTDNQKHKNQNK